ncbi:L,D-transpeptidase [Bacillus pinisoli]|uniref:L,D-transpeptidase n=1 Tax=Bacillus pinisoli TaxID=2901866 RepID=UPI001FF3CC7E|nr:L,D-transpeptidase [Bacillus pinisoli]
MSILQVIVAIILTISPIWPLGPNPLPGDPYIIVNKNTHELAFFNKGELQQVYPVGTGLFDDFTPEGTFTITVKAKDPYYRRKNIMGGSPENPLGSRWIGFDALETDGRTYGVHGTNNPSSIGKAVSQGCIRMHNEHVNQLFDLVPLGTKIFITSSDESFNNIAQQQKVID